MKRIKKSLILTSSTLFFIGIVLVILKITGYLLFIQGYFDFSLILGVFFLSIITGYVYFILKSKIIVRIILSFALILVLVFYAYAMQSEQVEWNREVFDEYEIVTEQHDVGFGGHLDFYQKENIFFVKYIERINYVKDDQISYHIENNILYIKTTASDGNFFIDEITLK